MARRNTKQLSVQLFPFLAVLVCVMGALIFLLLVTTKTLRQKTIARAMAEARQAELLAAIPSASRIPESLPASVAEEAMPVEEAPAWQPPAPTVDETALRAEEENLRQMWQSRVRELEQAVESQQTQLNLQKLLAMTTQQSLSSMKQEMVTLEANLARLMGQASSTPGEANARQLEQAALEQRIAALRQQLKQLEQEQQEAQSRFSIVPFDGKSGTTRRPIFIECTATGLIFQPEEVKLRPADLDGFNQRFNPLAAGSLALVDYWSRSPESANEQPYVLLIVRPNGTLAYYIAMKLLSGTKLPFGYELVTEDMQLQLPPADAEAQRVVKEAITLALEQRNEAMAGGAGQGIPGLESGRDGFSTSRSARMPGRADAGGSRPGLNGSGRGNQGSGTSQTSGGSGDEFSLEGLGKNDAGTVGSKSWQDIDRFEGQEHRRPRIENLKAGAPSGGNPANTARGRDAGSGNSASPSASAAARVREGERPDGTTRGTSETADNREGTAAGTMTSSNRQAAAGVQGASGAAGAEMQDGEPGPEVPYPQLSRQKPRRNDQPTRMPYEQLQRRKWGPHDPGASIGVERKVEIRMDSRQAIIDNDLVIPIAPQASQRDLFLQILSGIDQMAQSWDAPGNGFFWVPSLNFVISPGGNAAYERMAPLIRKSGLSSTTAFTLEGARVTAPAEVKP